MTNLSQIIILVGDFFKGDEHKIAVWLDTVNPFLGNQRPWDMIKNGRSEKLLEFVTGSMIENNRDGK